MSETIAIIPAFNEEKTIGEVIKRFKEIRIDPIVIDDGSTDSTAIICFNNKVLCIKHLKNKGKGESLWTAFNYLKFLAFKSPFKFKYVGICDADLQYNPYEILKLLEVLKKNEADYVIGCRDWKTVPFRHYLGNMIWTKTFNFLFGTDLKDTNCGFVAMKFEVMKTLKAHSGYVVDNSLIIQVLKNNFRVKNVSVSVRYDSKRDLFSGIRMVSGILIFMFRAWREWTKKKKERT